MARTLVLGIGNSLLSDEGAGVHAVRYLESKFSDLPDVTCLDGGTLSFTLATPIEEADNLIVFDAARLDSEPGTVRCMVGGEMDAFVGKGKLSVHEVGLADLMDIARLSEHLPKRRALIGIQPKDFDWGPDLSDPVATAVPEAVEIAVKLIRKWSGERRETEPQQEATHGRA